MRNPITEYIGVVRSVHLGNVRTVWTRAPRDRSTRNLVIFLDAELYRDRVRAADVVQELSTTGDIADAWFVFVSMHSVEARWVECPCHPAFAKFISEELFSWLSTSFPETRHADRRTLIGLSYTGLAAAYIAKKVPGVFHRIVCQSGSFWWHDCWLVKAYDQTPILRVTEFYLEVGSREVQENVRHREDVLQVVSQVEGVRRFRDMLLRHDIPVNYSEYEGGHEFQCWSKTLPQALRWAVPNQAMERTAAATGPAPL